MIIRWTRGALKQRPVYQGIGYAAGRIFTSGAAPDPYGHSLIITSTSGAGDGTTVSGSDDGTIASGGIA